MFSSVKNTDDVAQDYHLVTLGVTKRAVATSSGIVRATARVRHYYCCILQYLI